MIQFLIGLNEVFKIWESTIRFLTIGLLHLFFIKFVVLNCLYLLIAHSYTFSYHDFIHLNIYQTILKKISYLARFLNLKIEKKKIDLGFQNSVKALFSVNPICLVNGHYCCGNLSIWFLLWIIVCWYSCNLCCAFIHCCYAAFSVWASCLRAGI